MPQRVHFHLLMICCYLQFSRSRVQRFCQAVGPQCSNARQFDWRSRTFVNLLFFQDRRKLQGTFMFVVSSIVALVSVKISFRLPLFNRRLFFLETPRFTAPKVTFVFSVSYHGNKNRWLEYLYGQSKFVFRKQPWKS